MRAALSLLIAILGFVAFAFSPAVRAQAPADADAGRAAIPFEEWYAAGERHQLPWKVELREQRLRADLRLTAGFSVTIPGRELNRLGEQHELFLLACIADQQGNWQSSYGLLRREVPQTLPADEDIGLAMTFVVRPGRYTLAVVLYDRVTGLRSLTSMPLHIEPVRNDPLPDLYRELPAVEFSPPATGIYRFLEPTVTSRLWLPVPGAQPPRVDVLINFGSSEPSAALRGDSRRLWILARTLRLFSQLGLPSGSLRITGVDADARRMLFVIEDHHNIPWESVRDALSGTRVGTVSADSLAGRGRNAWFFRETIQQVLTDSVPANSGDATGPLSRSASKDFEKRVLIVVSNPVDFTGSEVARMPRMDCNCRVFYFCYRFVDTAASDDLGGFLGPLRPRRFDLYRPEDVRKALAAVLKEIGQP